ncbi:3-hydroxyacyl-CoA dehydratase PASTICCINO 2A [Glycine soja]|uniref:Very-long-chain (3R)-3-hydroxyacyl-CoA dehydratase n=1 Tax=Glycine soja TaxID=3848 RepID=A0A0B2PZ83_GLYSO|nr:3-hydroxyacyl-CoA dehydratase PASTICCINO 2A [Glycine soja]
MAGFFSLLRRLYLSLYNWTVLFGWCQVLYFVLKTLNESGHQHVYSAAEKPLHYAQSAAVLEILHGLVGLVRSPVTATLPQISSRLFLVWGILWSFPETRSHVLVTSLLISWSITEANASGKYCIRMPNKWNSSFDYFYAAIVAMGIYVPGSSPHLYTYMLAQRKKALSKSKRE